jgi:diguanylate cyclase (GGDEF)-like protein
LADDRIARYREAAERLREGHFDISIPAGGEDEISRLGEALENLAGTLKEQSEQAAMLARITQKINEGLVLEEVLDQVYENFSTLIPYHRIGLALLEDGKKTVRAHWARSEAEEVKLPLGYSARLAGSSLEEVIRTGQPRILNDLEAYLERHPDSDSTRKIVEEGMRSSLTCPLQIMGQAVGFLFFSSMEKDTYSEIHQELFARIARQLSVIVEKGRLYQGLMELTDELKTAQKALKYEATRDSLTDLWNRRSILDLLKRELARADREEMPLSAVMIDVDEFKPINDRIGHAAGDEVLRQVTRRVASTLRSSDVFGRLGGEEFLIILYPGDEQTAVEVMERARRACAARPVTVDGEDIAVTVSLGAGITVGPEVVDLPTILKIADRALYRAKNGGRNRSEFEVV